MSSFIETLNVPAVSLRIPNPYNNIHAANENIKIKNLEGDEDLQQLQRAVLERDNALDAEKQKVEYLMAELAKIRANAGGDNVSELSME